ncbi:MAG TPA: glycosyltransferase family 2 protein [Candidatus Onthocola stercoravium]|nr:glycosyltransferase family 2 protein [Candidatus Onthocola stercoravium]
MLINLLWKKKEKKGCSCNEEDVTVLIPVYNANDSIKDTIESIKKQNYCGKINIIVIDDGSVDDSVEILKKMEIDENMILLERPHQGKTQALNEGLKLVETEYMITIDSDTVLHRDAIRNIMDKLVNSNKKVVATAGCLFVKNAKKNFITKLQEWDYTLGIFGVKFYQSNYNSTLVAQGAFSAYKTEVIKRVLGWQDCVGEDIVLTWKLLSLGYEVNFAKKAIAFTEVPITWRALGKQRKRWARGMIEAFKKVKIFTSHRLNFRSKFLMSLNLFFPFIDLALLIFIPLGIFFLLLGNQLLMGWLTLLVIFLGMILCLVIEIRRRSTLREINCRLDRRSVLTFIFYVLLYAFILAPYCLMGYISELFNYKKKW